MEIKKVIVERDGYALIELEGTVTQFAVVRNLDKEKGDWAYSCGYFLVDSDNSKTVEFAKAIDLFCHCTEENYVSRKSLLETLENFDEVIKSMH